jgi:guanylate kinase
MKNSENNIFVLSGPSGVGKSTLAEKLLTDLDRLKKTISFTTRIKRASEIDGVDYHFIDEPEFKKMVENNEFIEWIQVYNNYYGTAISTLKKMLVKTDILMVIEMNGAKNIKKYFPHNAILIYMLPPSLDELEKRLFNRGCNTSKKDITKRLSSAKDEIKRLTSPIAFYDYAVINDEFSRCFDKISSIIIASRSRLTHMTDYIEFL